MIFRPYGHSYHLRIETADDLRDVVALDEAHWVATSAPVNVLNCDATFLALLDADASGRIACRDVKEAIGWLLDVLADREGVTRAEASLRLARVNADHPDGRTVLQAARKSLRRLGRPDGEEIALDEVRRIKADAEATPVSEAGVVLPKAAADEEVQRFLADVLATVGGVPHPSGESGVGAEKLDEFLAEADDYLTWYAQGEIPPGKKRTDIMPLGRKTPQAYEAFAAVRGKIDQFFAQCEVLGLDERFVKRMGWTEGELEGLDFDDPAVIEEVLRKAPLARANAERALRFAEEINPYYAERLERFRRDAAGAVLADCGAALASRQWQEVRSFFAAHQAWLDAKAGRKVEALGAEMLREYQDPRFAECVRDLIAASGKTAVVLDNIRLMEKLLLYQSRMIALANNLVSFPHLYDPSRRAMFELGTLVMDARRYNLAVRVDNRAAHAQIAKTSNMYVLYVRVTPPGGKAYEVAVPVTSGSMGNLCKHKRGVFYDLDGTECAAQVVDIIENPISFREALVSPFRRLGKLLTGKIEAITAKAEKKLDTQAGAALGQIDGKAAPAAPQAGKPMSGAAAGGLLMGAGVAVAALTSAMAYVAKTLAGVSWLALLIGVLAAVLLVMLPTSIVAFLKLRKRDLSAILEGSGWAINARMRLTRRQGRFFTRRPAYPKGSRGTRSYFWQTLIVTVLVLAGLAVGGYYLRKAYVDSKSTGTPASQRAGKK